MTDLKSSFRAILFFFFCASAIQMSAQPASNIYGQHRIKLFRSKDDSIRYTMVEKSIDEELSHSPLRHQKMDSLTQLQSKIFAEGIVFKTVYRPSKDFILTDSLTTTSDFLLVKKLCIYNKKEIPEILWNCKDLEALEFINTSIKRLPKELAAFPNLKSIGIYHNRIRKRLRLSKNVTVNSLTIRSEQQEGLPRSYKKFGALNRLDLAENGLTKFPNGARHNKKMTDLSLQRNALTLKDKIKTHRYLERLSLHGNLIEHVPASIKNCRNLNKLNFNSNKISSVDAGIGALKKLEQLSFYNNQLTEVPSGVYKIRTLKEIDLFHNQIEALGPEFCNWQNLVTLYLSHNKLISLPENIDTLKSLEGLYLWDNRLGKLPVSIGEISQMKYLRINNNYLKELPTSIQKLSNMEELDISHNYISEIPEGIFLYPKLKILAMVNNPWSEAMWKLLADKIEVLRAKNIFVHLSDKDEKQDRQ